MAICLRAAHRMPPRKTSPGFSFVSYIEMILRAHRPREEGSQRTLSSQRTRLITVSRGRFVIYVATYSLLRTSSPNFQENKIEKKQTFFSAFFRENYGKIF